MTIVRRGSRALVRLALKPERIRRVVRAELGKPSSARVREPETEREFVDRHGRRHRLDPGLRDRLKPGWQTMLDPGAANRPPSDDVLADRARRATLTVREADRLVAAYTGGPLAGRILEVGCYDGAVAFQLGRREGAEVVASDLARYYVVQRPGAPTDDDVHAQQNQLAAIRERARHTAGVRPDAVRFVEDDVTQSNLDAAGFDAIVSFEVLEHLLQPTEAFSSMARLLRPGGIGYHDYNPFYSAKGGHSLCTLDFPWGHVRLDALDFERYLREVRPTEAEQALRFYRENLNRMTLADLRAAVSAGGLELLAMHPWFDRGLLADLDQEVVSDVQRAFPSATPEDLLATYASVIVRRPA